ncbi:LapD/MoxY N-terminal periplasmic domain-containing protein [Paracoccus shanxieyensis]|uniref:HAMP domain-containing protein n=1 Tax=Paracoccus shanxieyensis TaxID=2675752 RepID=A0A6L6IWR7_9RHOB|nr:LapD/MoxY N-terminal periplasmic domain-containing protein [Paracoccus shanxieyensis]MTH64058.1 HAMP domain-containing protein [Paracoccus shanxieyensis]MTH86901.1 HAMP domain-containing protein [Paracoccus shanxieyensis]
MSAQSDSTVFATMGRAAPRLGTLPMRRIIIGIAAAVSLSLCVIVSAILILNARHAVQDEIGSAFHLAHESVVRRLPPSHGGRDTMAEAAGLAEEIDGLRHVSARILDPAGLPLQHRANGQLAAEDAPPRWFSALMTPAPIQALVPITHYPNVLGMFQITADPTDEIAEVWDDFSVILPVLFLTGLAMVGLAVGLSSLLGRRLQSVQAAMAQMQAGDLSVRAPGDRLTEFADLAAGVNALASHLQAERAENDLLQSRLIGSSEAERSRIALDLHDEMGPQLFALRAAASHAQAMTADLPASPAALAETLDAIARHAVEIQKSARTAINDLRPMLLGEASLTDLLAELVAGFRDVSSQTRIILDIDPAAEGHSPGELAELSIYRFVRESVLNAMRHGQATLIRVSLEPQPDDPAQLVARVTDNGRGPQRSADGARPAASFGQIGMQDRARALGATYLPPWRDHTLTHTELRMPRP